MPVHPGEVPREELLQPMGLNPEKLADSLRVPTPQLEELLREQRQITADMALRLARYFDMSPQFWLGLQMDYDLDVAQDTVGQRLENEIVPIAA